MIYIILGFVSLVMILGTVATVTKAGQNDGICKYGHDDE